MQHYTRVHSQPKPRRMHRPLFSLALGSLLWWISGWAAALEFGPVSNPTVLGQPLKFMVTVKPGANDVITAECVSAVVFVGDNEMAQSDVSVAVEPAWGGTETVLRVGTRTPIVEPVVSVKLVFNCPTHWAHRFVSFVDPPAAKPPLLSAAGSVPATAPARQFEPGFARLVVKGAADSNPSQAPQRQSVPRRASNLNARTRDVVAASPAFEAGASGAHRAAPQVSKVAKARPPGARLRLDFDDEIAPIRAKRSAPKTKVATPAKVPAPAVAAAAVKLVAPTEEAAPAEPAASEPLLALDALMQQRAADREQIRALEEELTRLRKEMQSTQNRLVQVRTRLSTVEAARSSGTLVYVLAAMVAMLGGAVGVLLWRVSSDQQGSQWLVPAEPALKPVAPSVPEHAGNVGTAGAPQPHDAPQTLTDEVIPPTMVASSGLSGAPAQVARAVTPMAVPKVAPKPQSKAAPPTLVSNVSRLADEMSIEELIDLEQRVEFFDLLGQEEAAIEVLQGAMHAAGRRSFPLPFLKLLEIYRRRDDRDAYEQVRKQFNARFNSHAPDWRSNQQEGRSLEDYPHVVAKLQSLWAMPESALQSIKAALLRRGTGGGTFDMPAYLDLMTLYSIAHELASSGTAAPGVDLFLPLGG